MILFQLHWFDSTNVLKRVVVQYTARLNAEKVKAFVHSLNEGKIPKKRFNCKGVQISPFELNRSQASFNAKKINNTATFPKI